MCRSCVSPGGRSRGSGCGTGSKTQSAEKWAGDQAGGDDSMRSNLTSCLVWFYFGRMGA
ncbi:MAG: hypothetical protein MZV64_18870 [Ignavibacteriales bacterium]|nr:hypothetical protein [Ignavibacteriales bacterium]